MLLNVVACGILINVLLLYQPIHRPKIFKEDQPVSVNSSVYFISLSLKCIFHNKNLVILEVHETQRLDKNDGILSLFLLQEI